MQELPCDTSRGDGPRAVAGSARTWFEGATLDLKDPLDLKNRVGMNLAKLSANGQITVPAEVRRRLHLVAGDKVLFVEGPNGEVVLAKAGLSALARVQAAFAGAADEAGLKDDDDVQALVDEMRDRSS